MNIMVTGHRNERLAGRNKEVELWLCEQLKKYNPDKCFSGMARGVDQIFAHQVIANGFPLYGVYPYKRGLSQEEMYFNEHSAKTIYHSERYSRSCYTERDYFMVDHADVVLVVWDGIPNGGTYVTMRYAERKGKEVVYFPWN